MVLVGVTLWETIANWFEQAAFCALSLVFFLGCLKVSEMLGFDPWKHK